jgi:hypothetical protein
VVPRIVPRPPRDHGPNHDEKKGDEKKATDRIDRFARAPTDDDADDDPDGNDNEDRKDDIPRGGRLPKATAHVPELRPEAIPRTSRLEPSISSGSNQSLLTAAVVGSSSGGPFPRTNFHTATKTPKASTNKADVAATTVLVEKSR